MNTEARLERLESAVWREAGRTQVIGRVLIGLLRDLKGKDPRLIASIFDEARDEAERLPSDGGKVFRSMKLGARETLDALTKVLAAH